MWRLGRLTLLVAAFWGSGAIAAAQDVPPPSLRSETADTVWFGTEAEWKDTLMLWEDADTVLSVEPVAWSERIAGRIDSILTPQLKERSQVGVMIYDLTADSVVYEQGARQSLRPASVEKLLTAIVALRTLGGSYPLSTTLAYTGEIADSVLWGDLWLRGEMDPMLDGYDAEALADSLGSMGIDSIAGRLMADCSFKDTLLYGEGWSWDDDNPVLSPLLYCGKPGLEEALSRKLEERGIASSGVWQRGEMPAEAVRVCERQHTVDQLLVDMLKKSNNLYAEAMFYHLDGAEGGTAVGKRAAERVERFVENLGFGGSDYNVADGCGLSLYNYTTAAIVVAALRYVYKDADMLRHLRPALPVAGMDGTLEERMRYTSAYGNVRAKTGTVNRVSTLAGYATSPEGHDVAFCILNQGLRSAATARRVQDRICIAITDE